MSISSWRDAQAFVDAVALIQVGVVDQALPAHGGAGLLEVDAHHHFQRVLVLLAHDGQAAGVVRAAAGSWIEQGPTMTSTVVLRTHDVVDAAAGVADQRFHGGAANGEEADQVLWRGNTVISLMRASSVWPVLGEPARYQESVDEVFRAVMAIFREVFDR
jgi:hypothetical protein